MRGADRGAAGRGRGPVHDADAVDPGRCGLRGRADELDGPMPPTRVRARCRAHVVERRHARARRRAAQRAEGRQAPEVSPSGCQGVNWAPDIVGLAGDTPADRPGTDARLRGRRVSTPAGSARTTRSRPTQATPLSGGRRGTAAGCSTAGQRQGHGGFAGNGAADDGRTAATSCSSTPAVCRRCSPLVAFRRRH
jgi:hypothetical protein